MTEVGSARIPAPRNILMSFFFYRRVDLDRYESCRIVADSGAFSARQNSQNYQDGSPVTTKRLVAWTKKWQHRLCWAACLDVANPEQTKINWQRMCDLGVPGIPTLHVGDNPAIMDWYAERGVDFLGLGGMAGVSLPDSAKMRWMVQIFKYARDNHPEMRFHGWGITHAKFLRLPFWSVDSSGWGSSYRYARLMLRDPINGDQVGVKLDGKGSVYSRKVAQMLVENYGVTPSDINRAGPHNRILLVRLSALSASAQEQHWRRTFRRQLITPPKWGRLPGWNFFDGNGKEECGPHMHLVDGHPPHLQIVADLAEAAQRRLL